MAHADARGNPCHSGSAEARAAAELALWRLMSFYDVPFADLDAAAAADPGWALPHLMRAGFLLSLTEPALQADAAAALALARARIDGAPAREKAHLGAVEALAEGRWHAACGIWDALLLEHPHDALALQWAHLWDFYRGDAVQLRLRPARVLPAWDEADPLYPYVLALHAFGLEECNLYPQAEETGRRALALDARVPWAVHAVAHVMEMQGRFEEGSGWLRQQQPHWAEGNGFAAHLWWHQALFRLEALDLNGALRLVDAHLAGDALAITLQRVDAASMLWRLHLLGTDVAARAAALVDGWAAPDDTAGYYAFNDVHWVLALVVAGDAARAEAWTARCAERALSGAGARRSNHAMAREVGLPLMRGLLAFARGDADAAVDAIYPVRALAQRFGGSHAQRDLIDQTLIAAGAAGRHRTLARALVNERLMAKPPTPLTRYWIERLDDPVLERA
jgi:hypothetical protein